MSTPSEAQRRLTAANPVASVSAKPAEAWSPTVLLERIEERTRDMQTQESPVRQHPRAPEPRRRRALVAVGVGLAILIPLLIVAVVFRNGNGEDVITPSTVATTVPTTVPTTEPTTVPTTVPSVSEPSPIEITAVDYAFQGIPDVIPAGTELKLVNTSTAEFHSALIVRLFADDDRTLDELAALDVNDVVEGDLWKIGSPQGMLLAAPGEEGYPARGFGGSPMPSTPGRYVVLDIFPVGADPAEAEAQANQGPPTPEQLEGTIPHYQAGMIAQFIIEE